MITGLPDDLEIQWVGTAADARFESALSNANCCFRIAHRCGAHARRVIFRRRAQVFLSFHQHRASEATAAGEKLALPDLPWWRLPATDSSTLR